MSYSVVSWLAWGIEIRPNVLPTTRGRSQRTMPVTGLACSLRRRVVDVAMIRLLSSRVRGREEYQSSPAQLHYRPTVDRHSLLDPWYFKDRLCRLCDSSMLR